MKTVIAFAALIALSGTAMAQQPADSVGKMVDALKGGGGGNNSPLKAADALNLPGNGGVARYVSGSKGLLGTGTGGWGNVGSSITGTQISNKPAK
jgi:hypothetical protein